MTDKRFFRDYADIKQAEAVLLDQHLVWSADFESIRRPLADLFRQSASMGHYAHPAILQLAQVIISSENDLTI